MLFEDFIADSDFDLSTNNCDESHN